MHSDSDITSLLLFFFYFGRILFFVLWLLISSQVLIFGDNLTKCCYWNETFIRLYAEGAVSVSLSALSDL